MFYFHYWSLIHSFLSVCDILPLILKSPDTNIAKETPKHKVQIFYFYSNFQAIFYALKVLDDYRIWNQCCSSKNSNNFKKPPFFSKYHLIKVYFCYYWTLPALDFYLLFKLQSSALLHFLCHVKLSVFFYRIWISIFTCHLSCLASTRLADMIWKILQLIWAMPTPSDCILGISLPTYLGKCTVRNLFKAG